MGQGRQGDKELRGRRREEKASKVEEAGEGAFREDKTICDDMMRGARV